MAKSIREVMSPNPKTVEVSTTSDRVARLMHDHDIGCLVVNKDDRFYGIVTDRDLVLRVMAKGLDPSSSRMEAVCSKDIATLSPSSSTEEAVGIMRDRGVRRIPVVEGGKAVGIVSLGDLAIHLDPHSVLAEISKKSPNK